MQAGRQGTTAVIWRPVVELLPSSPVTELMKSSETAEQ